MSEFGMAQAFIEEHKFTAFAVFLFAIFVEAATAYRLRKPVISNRQLVTGTISLLIELGLRSATVSVRLFVFGVAARFAVFSIPNHLVTGVMLYVGVDAIYYFRHRLMHSTRWGWALHAPHHTSTTLNLLHGARLGWLQRLVDDFFYLPLVFVGFSVELLIPVMLLNEIFPLWCHSEFLPRIPTLEGLINTPATHRIHHSMDPQHRGRNFGSTFMIWDRVFGTWNVTEKPLEFGVPEVGTTDNIFKQQFNVLIQSVSSLTRENS